MAASQVRKALLALVAATACVWCGGKGGGNGVPFPGSPTETVPPGVSPGTGVIPPGAPEVFVGAGDIAWCGSGAPEQTARLLDGIGGQVFAAGDNAYFSGTDKEYRECYEPTWGRHKNRTRPVPGNHEYETPGATGYFNYFGALAGPSGLGYYSFDMVGGNWHIVALNSEIAMDDGSAQARWLRADLAASRARCTLAYWHRPLFTSGPNREQTQMRDLWRILHDANAEVVVNGHDHVYERFSPQDPDGRPDASRGLREFVVGTGGANLYDFVKVSANSEKQLKAYGVLKFTLQTGGYQWEFISVSGSGDSGAGSCH